EVAPLPSSTTIATCSRAVTWTFSAKLLVEREVWLLVCPRRTVILRRNPWAPLAGSLRAGQARGLRSQARFAQGRPVGSARRLASRRAGDEGSIQLLVATVGVADPSRAQDDTSRKRGSSGGVGRYPWRDVSGAPGERRVSRLQRRGVDRLGGDRL